MKINNFSYRIFTLYLEVVGKICMEIADYVVNGDTA